MDDRARTAREELLAQLDGNPELPEYPELLARVSELSRDPDVDVREVAALLETDPVLVGRLLKLANSAWYGGGRMEIRNVQMAIMRLGLKEVRKILYSYQMEHLFRDCRLVDHHLFWRHSLAVALFSQELLRYLKGDERFIESAYLAGLMHDLGILVFATLVPDEYEAFLREGRDLEVPIQRQEVERFGIDHAELGAEFVVRAWVDEPAIIAAIGAHHNPFKAEGDDRTVSHVVHIANGICDNFGIDNGLDVYKDLFKVGAWDGLGLTLEDAEDLLFIVRNTLDQVEAQIGV